MSARLTTVKNIADELIGRHLLIKEYEVRGHAAMDFTLDNKAPDRRWTVRLVMDDAEADSLSLNVLSPSGVEWSSAQFQSMHSATIATVIASELTRNRE